PWLLVASSVFGGLTAAMIGILTPLVVADCMKGTGRYNLGLGMVGMLSGIGATVSTVALGAVAQRFGFIAGFGSIAATVLLALAAVWWLMPETAGAAASG
ncbi:MAG: MFS transporter, partial [Acetobacteraceae bacterium]|nr:MFS transporter [Acetobacteraceae bacterium]